MIKILKILQKENIKGEHRVYSGYILPEFKQNEYLALMGKSGKLCNPSNQKPYITRDLNNFLFHGITSGYKTNDEIVLVEVDNTDECTLLGEGINGTTNR